MTIKIPKSLYRYRKIEVPDNPRHSDKLLNQELKGLLQSYLWFSKFSDLNDPMEGAFAHNINSFPEEIKPAIKALINTAKRISICSLSSRFDNRMMWGLYAGESTGICIEYNPRSIMDWMVEETPLLEVAYRENPPKHFNNIFDLLRFESNESTPDLAQKLMATKHIDWSNEGEFRLIRPTNHQFHHHKSAIISITMGINQKDNATINKILECAQKLSVPLYKIDIDGYSISRTEVYSPPKIVLSVDFQSSDEARKLVTDNNMNLALIPAVAHAITSAKADPHCASLTDYDIYSSGEYMWFNYECNLPDTGNMSEVNRRKQMKFKLLDNKSKRDWSVRISERHYS